MTAPNDAPSLKDSIPPRWRDANVLPLWLSRTAHKPAPPPPLPSHWAWERLRGLIVDVQHEVDTDMVERRVLQLLAADLPDWSREATCGQVLGAIQCLMPGERARPHRHTMQALRFMLEGSGAVTIVNGKECPMEFGDLILTPSMAWHEHYHGGTEPALWLDVLDVPLHIALRTIKFEAGPPYGLPSHIPDVAYAPGMVPVTDSPEKASTQYRYPYAWASAALPHCPVNAVGLRELRYVTPETGDDALHTLSCSLQQLEQDTAVAKHCLYEDRLCCVVEGEGYSEIGDMRIDWRSKDVFTIPRGQWARHVSLSKRSRLFVVSNAPLMRWLGCHEAKIEPTC